MGANSIRILPEPLRSRDSATFTGSYQTLGTPITNPSKIMKVTNNSAVLVTLSWDGISDHEILPSGSFILLDFTSNAGVAGLLVAAANTQFYIKGTASTGSVYLSTYHATQLGIPAGPTLP